jgi:hypothetical protein
MHGGLSDPRAMGKVGKRVSEVRTALKDDEAIREHARDVIKRGMAGDASVTKMQLDAARSVFSFRSAEPPREQREHEDRWGARGTRTVTSLADVIAFAATEAHGVFENPEFADAIETAHAKVQQLKAEGRIAASDRDGDDA